MEGRHADEWDFHAELVTGEGSTMPRHLDHVSPTKPDQMTGGYL
jgi:hypothetical protein